jgi:hypothetical protein
LTAAYLWPTYEFEEFFFGTSKGDSAVRSLIYHLLLTTKISPGARFDFSPLYPTKELVDLADELLSIDIVSVVAASHSRSLDVIGY